MNLVAELFALTAVSKVKNELSVLKHAQEILSVDIWKFEKPCGQNVFYSFSIDEYQLGEKSVCLRTVMKYK